MTSIIDRANYQSIFPAADLRDSAVQVLKTAVLLQRDSHEMTQEEADIPVMADQDNSSITVLDHY